mgnify:CR=1 FL=1
MNQHEALLRNHQPFHDHTPYTLAAWLPGLQTSHLYEATSLNHMQTAAHQDELVGHVVDQMFRTRSHRNEHPRKVSTLALDTVCKKEKKEKKKKTRKKKFKKEAMK